MCHNSVANKRNIIACLPKFRNRKNRVSVCASKASRSLIAEKNASIQYFLIACVDFFATINQETFHFNAGPTADLSLVKKPSFEFLSSSAVQDSVVKLD